jgi:hypothetical protein
MSRRINKNASQAETADVVTALSEAAGSSSSSAPIYATRGASAALLAKEILPDCDQQLRIVISLFLPSGVEFHSVRK